MAIAFDYTFVVLDQEGRSVLEAKVAIADAREVAPTAYLVATDERAGPADRSGWTVEVRSPFGTPLGCLPFSYAERCVARPVQEDAAWAV